MNIDSTWGKYAESIDQKSKMNIKLGFFLK